MNVSDANFLFVFTVQALHWDKESLKEVLRVTLSSLTDYKPFVTCIYMSRFKKKKECPIE